LNDLEKLIEEDLLDDDELEDVEGVGGY